MSRETELLQRVRRLLLEVRCQATGCYAATGHQPSCIRGRAERLIAEINDELVQQKRAIP